MQTFDQLETSILRFSPQEFITFLMDMRFIPNEVPCNKCGRPLSLAKYNKSWKIMLGGAMQTNAQVRKTIFH